MRWTFPLPTGVGTSDVGDTSSAPSGHLPLKGKALNVQRCELVEALSADGDIALAVAEHDHRRAAQAVVVGGHRIVIRPRGADGHPVAALYPGGQADRGLEDIAAFAATARQVEDRRLPSPVVFVQDGVSRAIEAVAGVIGHAAVHDHVVLEARDALDGADGVDGHARVRHDAAAGLHEDERHGQARLVGTRADVLRQGRDAPGDIRLLVGIHIAHAVAAAEVEGFCHIAELLLELPHEGQHQIGGVFKDALVEDHGADMAVQALERHVRSIQRGADKFQRLARADGDAELHVHPSGVHRLVGVRVDAGRDAQEYLLPHAAHARLAVQSLKLLRSVHHEAADAVVEGITDIRVGFAVAVEPDPLRREARLQGGMDFAAGDAVDAHPLLCHDAVHLPEGAGLAGIERQGFIAEGGAEGVLVHAAVEAYARLVHEVEGRAVTLGQGGDGLPGKEQRAVFVSCDVGAQHGITCFIKSPAHFNTLPK